MKKLSVASRRLIEPLESRTLLASASTLLQYDFNGATAWPQMATAASAGVTASAAQGPLGTIDVAGGTTKTGAVSLTTTASPTGGWTSELNSGLLAVSNAETNLGKLTLSFDLSVSQSRNVRVRVTSFNAQGQRTGALETEVNPAAADFYQRSSIDLSTMKPAGTGTFDPTAPFVAFGFEASGQFGWTTSAACQVRVDNVNYSKPAYYVSGTGSDAKDGKTEANAFRTPQAAIKVSQPGDIILMMNGTYNNVTSQTGAIAITKGGTPADWLVVKNYPGQSPLIKNEAWNAILIGGTTAAPVSGPGVGYVEIRGLHIRGNSDYANTAYPTAIGKVDPRTNNNGIAIEGRNDENIPHHIRLADNFVEYCSGGGMGMNEGDWITIENNVVEHSCYWTIYGPSGISFLGIEDFDGTVGNYKRLIRNNISSGNECFVPDATNGKYTDGNGIIVDVNKNTAGTLAYHGRTLVENNIAFDNGGAGVHAYKADHIDFFNNVAYLNSASPQLQYAQMDSNNAADMRIYNNIMVAPVANTASGEKAEPVNGGPAAYFHNNIYFGGNTGPVLGTGDRKIDPKFVLPSIDAAVADFRLQSNSPAINAGLTVGTVTQLDFLGNSRTGVPDLGAYEYYAATPTIVTAAAATPSPVTGKTTTLTVTVGDDDGPAGLTYTWAATAKPAGAADPVFVVNGAANSKSAIATFSKAGVYTLTVTAKDADGLSATSSVVVTVVQTLSGLLITPANAVVGTGATQQYAASGLDQFGQAMPSGPVTWSTTGSGNAVSAAGLFTASASLTGAFSITAGNGTFSASATGTVADLTPPTLSGVVSRKGHGAAGTFDLPLSLDPLTPTVEPRINGASTLVFTFSEPIAAGDGVISANEFLLTNATFQSVSVSGVTLTLQLSGVIDQARTTVTLRGLNDTAGNALAGTSAVVIKSLYGDANGNGIVNATDVALLKNYSGEPITNTTYLLDLNASGLINSTDVALVKSLVDDTVR